MIVRVRNIRMHVDEPEAGLLARASERLGVPASRVQALKVVKRAVDARRREVYFNYSVDVTLKEHTRLPRDLFRSPEISVVEPVEYEEIPQGDQPLAHSPIIVGSGPCGLFAAYELAGRGYRPIVLERGKDMDRRIEDVERFWREGTLDPESNVQFGEGGAGTFSDGKLTTRIGDPRVDRVLATFVRLGAPEEITWVKHPHVGTDRIREVVRAMRREILLMGGQIFFDARVTDIVINGGRIAAVEINDNLTVPADVVVLAVGNSARDVYRMLEARHVSMIPKGFAMGVRVEHPQDLIDSIQYGKYAGHPRLGPAEYQVSYNDEDSGRHVYSFCMCPGGQVIAGASASGQVVTNGMSYYDRGSGRANSALVVTVSPDDWDETPLGGVELQETVERAAFALGGWDFRAPAQKVTDFLLRRPTREWGELEPSYRPGWRSANLWDILPPFVAGPLERAIRNWDRRMPGFAGEEAVLTGVETRTSAPLRIERGDSYQSVSVSGLFPAGEGAGYAGGIVSAAVDGIRVAEEIIRTYMPPESVTIIDGGGVVSARSL